MPNLVLAGRTTLQASLMGLIQELDLVERVSIHPDVPQTQMPSLYRGASVYLQTSYEEGLGISVLEAMASGLPVVATDTAGTRETIDNGETGWLVSQDGDVPGVVAARAVSVLKSYSNDMSRRARERAVSLFSDQATLWRHLDVYDQLLADRPVGDR